MNEKKVTREPGTDRSTYVHTLPSSASFTGKGFLGYSLGPFQNKNVEILYVESVTGHDTFFISRKLTRFYYILSGSGSFTIEGLRYPVGEGMLVEVPPKVEFTYSGKMTMIAVGTPRWRRGNEITTKWNPDVTGEQTPVEGTSMSGLAGLLRMRVLGKSPVGGFLRLNQAVWSALPTFMTSWAPIRMYGNWLHAIARIQMNRAQALSTYFLRNRAELELIGSLLENWTNGDLLRVTVLGCSTGAEAYSVAWTIRRERPDLKLSMQALDISKQAVEFAQVGEYSITTRQLIDTPIFSAMTAWEMDEMFNPIDGAMSVKPSIREGISWRVGDAGDPSLLEAIGIQDLVVANNFLCHMDDVGAERCLRTIAKLVRPGGYIFVSGIAAGVRAKVAADLGWQPIQKLLEEILESDRKLGARWPCHYAAPEPMNKARRDWRLRYAAAYQTKPAGPENVAHTNDETSEHSRLVGANSGRFEAK